MSFVTNFSSLRRSVLVALLLSLALLASGCKRKRRANPAESPAASRVGVGLVPTHVETRDPATASQLLKGFYKVEDGWRWTAGQFSVLLGVPKGAAANGGVLKLKFTIPQAVLDKVHQQTVSASLRGKALGPETYSVSGVQTYSRPIPPELLTGQGVEVDFTVNPVLPPGSADMRELGVIATSIAMETK